MPDAASFPFVSADSRLGEASFRPYMPLRLNYQGRTVETSGLLDTGAAVNVLPYRIGIQLGAVWERQTISLPLTGNLARYEARLLMLSTTVANFTPIRLAFAWSAVEHVPLLLGQMNFFVAFNVCFFRSELRFEVTPISSS